MSVFARLSLASLLFIALGMGAAQAQQQSGCKQSGSVTPGHLAAWTTNCVLQDGGTPANPMVTGGLGMTSSNQVSLGINNAKNTGAYNQLGLGVTNTAGYITLAPFGGAPDLPLNIAAPAINLIVGGTIYPFPGPTGPFFPIAGTSSLPTTIVGTIGQTLNSTLTGAVYPPGPIGLNQSAAFTGTTTAGIGGTDGVSLAFNRSTIVDSVFYTPPFPFPGSKNAWELQYTVTGGTGGANAMSIDSNFSPIGTYTSASSQNFGGLTIYTSANGNYTGATSGAGGLGDVTGLGVQMRQNLDRNSAPVYLNQLVSAEFDMDISGSGDTVRNKYIVKLGSGGTVAQTASDFSAFITMNAAAAPGPTAFYGQLQYGIAFGNLQGGGFPVAAGGTLLYALPGSTGYGADFSAVTFSGGFLKGPNNFLVHNSGQVDTNAIAAPSNVFDVYNTALVPMFQITGNSAATVNFLNVLAGIAGNPVSLVATAGTPTPDTNVNLVLRTGGSNGTTAEVIMQNAPGAFIAEFQSVASATSHLYVTNAANAGPVAIDAIGTGTLALAMGTVSETAVNIGNSASQTSIAGTLFTGATYGTLHQGLTCAPGAPSASFATNNGLVIHC